MADLESEIFSVCYNPICMIAPIILGGTVAEAVYLYMTPKDRHDIR